MKRTVLILLGATLCCLFSLSLYTNPTHAQTTQECALGNESIGDDVLFRPDGQRPDYDENDPHRVELVVYFKGACKNHTFTVDIKENKNDPAVYSQSYTIPLDYGIFIQQFTTGTLECENTTGDDCAYEAFVNLYKPDSTWIEKGDTDDLEYEIVGNTPNTIPWIAGEIEWTQNEEIQPCRATQTKIFIVDPNDGSTSPITPGAQPSSFYKDDDQPLIRVQQTFVGCGKRQGEVFGPAPSLTATGFGPVEFISRTRINTPYDKLIVESTYKLGDKGCFASCRLYFPTSDQLSYWKANYYSITQEDVEVDTSYWNAAQQVGGYITYSCDGECDTPWGGDAHQAFRCLNESCTDVEPIELSGNQFLAGYLASLQNSPCYIPPQNPNDPTDLGGIKPDCYELLAPLPGLEALGVPVNNETDAGFASGVYTNDFTLGIWINRIVTFIIGLIGLAAVVMIVIAGAQYMTTEAIGQKSDAKDRIVQALIGLVIALGIFIILRTINPYLLNVDPDIEAIQFEYEDTTEVLAIVDENGNTTYNYSQCKGGGPDTSATCTDCVPFTNNEFPTTLPNQANMNISAGYKAKLTNFKNAIIAYNASAATDIEAVITEAYPPTTMRHCSQCHYIGTCTDIALRLNGSKVGGLDVQVIAPLVENFITLAQQSGLRAEYEIKSGQRCSELEALMPSSFPDSAIKCVQHITGEHFSVYNN